MWFKFTVKLHYQEEICVRWTTGVASSVTSRVRTLKWLSPLHPFQYLKLPLQQSLPFHYLKLPRQQSLQGPTTVCGPHCGTRALDYIFDKRSQSGSLPDVSNMLISEIFTGGNEGSRAELSCQQNSPVFISQNYLLTLFCLKTKLLSSNCAVWSTLAHIHSPVIVQCFHFHGVGIGEDDDIIFGRNKPLHMKNVSALSNKEWFALKPSQPHKLLTTTHSIISVRGDVWPVKDEGYKAAMNYFTVSNTYSNRVCWCARSSQYAQFVGIPWLELMLFSGCDTVEHRWWGFKSW